MKRITATKYSPILFIFIFSLFSSAQENGFSIPDSLKNKTYREIFEKFNENSENEKLSALYAKVYLEKGRIDKKIIKKATGYRLLFIAENDHKKRIKYLDSAIVLSRDLKNLYYPAVLFINKGIVLHEKGQYEEALANYLEAIRYSKINNNEDFVYFNLHNIGLLKRTLGEYSEAIEIFKKCMKFEGLKENKTSIDSVSYAITGIELSKTYTLISQIDSSTNCIEKIKPFLPNKKDGVFYSLYFNRGLNEYFKKNYALSIDILNECIEYASKNDMILSSDEEFFPEAFYYLSENYDKIKDKNRSIIYAKKIDSCFESHKIPSKEVRKAYEKLIKLYKEQNNAEMQLLYIEKLLSIDSLLLKDYKVLNKSMSKEFDTPNLINEKEEIIFNLRKVNNRSYGGLIILTILLLILSILAWFYYRRQQVFKQRFDRLVNEQQSKPIKNKNHDKQEKKSSNINEKVLNQILSSLKDFEENNKFIARKITLSSLAKDFETNPRYLSLVVNEYKDKSFSNYLNDLRIDYAIEKLKTDKTFRKYAIKAIAYDVGFNNTQSFSNAFYKETGIYPSYFIKKINESNS